jgi:hypothetical protein
MCRVVDSFRVVVCVLAARGTRPHVRAQRDPFKQSVFHSFSSVHWSDVVCARAHLARALATLVLLQHTSHPHEITPRTQQKQERNVAGSLTSLAAIAIGVAFAEGKLKSAASKPNIVLIVADGA